MVTYIDTKNREKYQVLFDKAEKTLQQAAENGNLPDGIDINSLEIVTLNQYFAYLQDLIALSSNENIKSYFLRLPLDEELFEINANTRTIKIPSNFSRNGVGVQGDETAEIVYFSIDRYFDHTDLANEEMNIVIQWEAKNKDKQTIYGISPNFGKDIETIPGKIIFGWPIYSELTQTPGTIKFAVRFFSLGEESSEGIRALNYSLATLPSEISVGATIDYDLIKKTVMEVDKGKMIINRIKNVGIYDPSIPAPSEPTISTPLYVVGYDNTVHIVDLPTEPGQGVTLRVSARPTDDTSGIVYDWRKYGYDSDISDYSRTSDPVSVEAINNSDYEEMTEDLGEDIYYRISSEVGQPVAYSPISVADYLAPEHPYVEDFGFAMADGGYVKLYKKYSSAVVKTPGIYTVNVGARNGVNTVFKDMETSQGIKIPGPLKPEISDPEPAENISITADHTAHIIVDDTGIVTLPVTAVAGETGKPAEEVGFDPVVTLAYDWKRIVGGVGQSVNGDAVPEDSMHVYVLGSDGHGYVPNDVNYEDCLYNQSKLSLTQIGNQIMVYATEELRTFASTNPSQGEAQWIGFDIDTGLETIEGAMWGPYEMTEDDVAEAASVGLGAGHIVFWGKAEDLAAGINIAIDDHPLRITFSSTVPSELSYSFNENKDRITISGLVEDNLDETYFVSVTARRNGIETSEDSGNYRITKAPAKPVLKRRVLNANGSGIIQKESDYTIETSAIDTPKLTRTGAYNSIAFSVEPIQHSDSLDYVWMRMNVQADVDSDWVTNEMPRLQVDLDNLLPDLFEDLTGDPDIAVDGAFGLTKLTELGEVVEDADNMPEFKFNADTEQGYYYCIVINELNNNRVANVTPFYYVHN